MDGNSTVRGIMKRSVSKIHGFYFMVKFVHCTLNKLKLTFVPRAALSQLTCVREGGD